MVSMSLTSYSSFLKENKLSTDAVNKQRIKNVGARISKAVEQYPCCQRAAKPDCQFPVGIQSRGQQRTQRMVYAGRQGCFLRGDITLLSEWCGNRCRHGAWDRPRRGSPQQRAHEPAGTHTIRQAAATEILGHDQSDARKAILAAAIGMGTNVGITLPFSRKHEYEADHLGLIFMAMAGYDPNEAVAFWTRMANASTGKQPEFLSTHPADEKRIAKLKEAIPEALKYKKN